MDLIKILGALSGYSFRMLVFFQVGTNDIAISVVDFVLNPSGIHCRTALSLQRRSQSSWIRRVLSLRRSLTFMYLRRVMYLYQPSLACSMPMWLVSELLPVKLKYLSHPTSPIPLHLPPSSSRIMSQRRTIWLIHAFVSVREKKPRKRKASQMD